MGDTFKFRKPWDELLWHAFFTIVAIIAIVLAIANLFFIRPVTPFSLLCSIGWIGIISLICVTEIREIGRRQWLIDLLGGFVSSRTLKISRDELGQTQVSYGYALAGVEFPQLKVRSEGLRSLTFTPGQASSLMGKDAHDWRTWFRFDLKSVEYNREGFRYGSCELGPSGKREAVEKFHQSLANFFQAHGIDVDLVCDLPARSEPS